LRLARAYKQMAGSAQRAQGEEEANSRSIMAFLNESTYIH